MPNQIHQLLDSRETINSLLAYQLLQSQLSYSPTDALCYIFEYQVKYCIPRDKGFFQWFIGDIQLELAFEYDDENGHAYMYEHVSLRLLIQYKDRQESTERFLGTFSTAHKGLSIDNYQGIALELCEVLAPRVIDFF